MQAKSKIGAAEGAKRHQSVVLTVGHSTRALETFIQLLQAHGVKHVVDVRTVPRSRRNPQFNRETLPDSLSQAKIRYTHLKELGGLRHPRPDSPNAGWRNSSFRGFADYMQTPEFAAGLAKLVKFAPRARVAVMCAEAVPWRCHRSLIADALLVRGVRVEHISTPTRRQEHTLTPFARAQGTRITYPPGADACGCALIGPASAAAKTAITRRAVSSADGEPQEGPRAGRRRGRSGYGTPT
jgi:Protein of unknown function, DUF488